jgi:galactokinase/mevalonate kinase-like predicted kinase
LFAFDNFPASKPHLSGSQDAIGLVYPGLALSNYANGNVWPHRIDHCVQERVCVFLETHLWLLELTPRQETFDVRANTDITPQKCQALANAAENCWNALLECDAPRFGRYFTASFEAQVAMFPNMLDSNVDADLIRSFRDRVLGIKLSGAGGGGYLIMVAIESPHADAFQIKVRRQ